ncbi:peptidylprolyl isomerase [Clostridium paraputrificum]|uniref:peptidylprolyl isomerase n=1 Tax=Clostridium paraputrificum TaxID=29363 RepID=UPI003D345B80
MKKSRLLKLVVVTVATTALLLVGCGTKDQGTTTKNDGWDKEVVAPKELPIATIKVKDYGTITAELYPQYAPNTVNNFISLANKGFYDGLTFHRVIESFVLQGGCPEGNGTGGPGYSIRGEFSENGYKYNTLGHTAGVLSMARSQNKDSAGSQFFIVTEESRNNSASLDGKYAGFGKVIDGMDVVDKIKTVETGAQDKPNTDVVIESIKVDTKGIGYSDPEKM